MISVSNKRYAEKIAEWSFFLGVIVLVFWKCKYGYATLDEAFYPTIGYRFLQGDAILYEEWSNTQLTGILMLPILKIYQIINGGMEGVYLYLRYTYTILKILIAGLIYYRFQRFGKRKAYVTAMLFLIFASYGMMVLSYNTFAIGGAMVALILLFDDKEAKGTSIRAILAGVAFAVSVLGIPYMIGLYGVYLVIMIAKTMIFKQSSADKYIEHLLSWKTFGLVTFGGGICGIGLLAYICLKSGFANVLHTIPYIIYGDPAHAAKSVYQMTAAYLVRILIGNDHNYWVFGGYVLLAIIVIAYFIDKRRNQRVEKYKFCSAVASLVLLLLYVLTDDYINSIIFIPNVLAFMLTIFNQNANRGIFYCIWIPGMLISYFEYLASNTGFSGISAASCVATVGSVIIICTEAGKVWEKTVPFEKAIRVFLIAILLLLLYYRSTYVFWEDGGIQSLTAEIDHGTAKGLYATENTKTMYNQMYKDTEQIRKMSEESMVLYEADNVLWMSGKQHCGSYSPLNYSLSVDPTILYDYYEIHPDKMADVMYISDLYPNLADTLATKYGYYVEKKEVGTLLWRERR